LRNAMFPIGGFTKDVVKKIAETSGFEKIAK
jgi:tRNA U34 2-thiouridine synthase MnmA/TrmU